MPHQTKTVTQPPRLKPFRRKVARLRLKSAIKAGPTRRAELDHVGAYNIVFTPKIGG